MSDDPINALISELFAEADHLAFDGKIHLRLPHEERSFVIGTFEAEIK